VRVRGRKSVSTSSKAFTVELLSAFLEVRQALGRLTWTIRRSAHDGLALREMRRLSIQIQSNSRGWWHRAFPHKRDQLRHLCDLACLLAKQVLNLLQPNRPRAWGRVRGSILFPNLWPTDGLRIVHSVGFVGFLVWLFCKLSCVLSTRPFVRHLLVVGRHGSACAETLPFRGSEL
jgi:hypothetical protein